MRRAATWGRQALGVLGRLWRHGGRLGQLLVISLVLCLAVASGAAASLSLGPSTPESPTVLTGLPVPLTMLPAIKSAAKSCPTLTGPRLAAQLMVASAFNPGAAIAGGGSGVAGLTEALWQRWMPVPGARRADASANIVALAHYDCDLAGQVRTAAIPGDAWRAVLATAHSGLPAVISAGGVPADANTYVDTVAAYAQWYAQQTDFGGTGQTDSSPSISDLAAAAPSPSVSTDASHAAASDAIAPEANGSSVDPAGGWRLTWSDEFSGAAGTAPNASRWSHETGGDGWGNKELEYHTSSTANAALDGSGHLAITARTDNTGGLSCWYGACQYTSARLVTLGHFSQAYGRISARIKMPAGQGFAPSFVAFGDNIKTDGWRPAGELSVATVVGDKPSTVKAGMVGPNYDKYATSTLSSGTFTGTYHTFTADWYPDHVTFSVDGRPYLSQYRAAIGDGWVFSHPFFLMLNIAVGGTGPGDPSASTPFPARMLVDWVRVYQAGPSRGNVTGTITGMGSMCVDGSGAQVHLASCTGAAGQSWTFGTDGTLRAQGKCLDAVGGGTTNGTRTQLAACDGTPGQVWQAETNGQLVNTRSGRCLDALDKSTADGTPIQLWDCWGAANQIWTLP